MKTGTADALSLGLEEAEALRDEITMLMQFCSDAAITVHPGETIVHADLPRLTRRTLGTLYNWRACSRPIPARKIAGRLFYRLEDVARWRVENSSDD